MVIVNIKFLLGRKCQKYGAEAFPSSCLGPLPASVQSVQILRITGLPMPSARRDALAPALATRIDDDGQVSHGRLYEFFRPVTSSRVEEQRVAWLHHITSVCVAVTHLAG